jgi:hypothetical protein
MRRRLLTMRLSPGALVAALLALFPQPLAAESLPIFLDGVVAEWTGVVELVDPGGDGGGSGIDFREIDLANDDAFLFIRFQVTAEIGLQDNNNVELYLDTDVNSNTGISISGIGAELMWQFGLREGIFERSNGSQTTIRQDDIRLRQLPSVTATEFEIAIGRDVKPDGSNSLFTGSSLRVLLREVGGDQAPNSGSGLTYAFDSNPVPDPDPIAFARNHASDVRVVTWNTRDLASGSSFDPGVTPSADRVLSALDPDVICFQELYNVSASQTAALVEGFLPSAGGEVWHAAKEFDNIVVSRFPVLDQWAIDANLAVLLDAVAVLGHDILLVCAHLPCCTNDSGRQEESDAIMQFFRDAMTAGGQVDVANGTVFMITGDLNLVGESRQLTTLLTGDILDNGAYGPDFNPDWDGTALADVISPQTEMRFAYTWRNDFSTFAPGRLDFIIHSDSEIQLANHFIVYTPEMSAAQRSQYGLQSDDVPTVSDHLPHVADFCNCSTADVGEHRDVDEPLRILATGRVGSPRPEIVVDTAIPLLLHVRIFDIQGKLVRTLRRESDGILQADIHRFTWDGHSSLGVRMANGLYLVHLIATPAVPGPFGAATHSSKIYLVR